MRHLWKALALLCCSTIAVGQQTNQDVPSDLQAADDDGLNHQSTIEYDRSNRMTLPVKVNGAPEARFLVDTGSERTVVSTELASLLNLPRGDAVRISGTVGSKVTTTAHVDSLDFKNITVNGLIAPLLERQDLGAEGLIGVDSLQQKMVIFDFENHQMEIKEPRRQAVRSKADGDEIVVTARNRLGRLIISKAYVDNVPVTIIIDSGSDYSIGNPALLEKMGKRKNFSPLMARLHSVTGQALDVPVVKAKRLEVGLMTLQDLPLAFADSPAFHTLGLVKRPALLLGMNSMRAFRRVEVDFKNRSVKFFSPDGAILDTGSRYASTYRIQPPDFRR